MSSNQKEAIFRARVQTNADFCVVRGKALGHVIITIRAPSGAAENKSVAGRNRLGLNRFATPGASALDCNCSARLTRSLPLLHGEPRAYGEDRRASRLAAKGEKSVWRHRVHDRVLLIPVGAGYEQPVAEGRDCQRG